MPSRNRPIITCASCGKQGPHEARGLCSTCYSRYRHRGTLDRYPATTRRRHEPWQPTGAHGERMLARFGELAAIRPPLTLQRIAWELGVGERQAQRYAAALRARQQQQEDR